VNEPRLTWHAKQRMEEREITEEDIRAALAHRSGEPEPASPGKNWVFGYCGGSRILKVLLTADEETIVSVMWRDD
jgi:hypothetical protein